MGLSLFWLQVKASLRLHVKAPGLMSVFARLNRLSIIFGRNATFLFGFGQRLCESLGVVLLSFHAWESPRGHRILMRSIPVWVTRFMVERHFESFVEVAVIRIMIRLLVKILMLRLGVLGSVCELLLTVLDGVESLLLKVVGFMS